MANKDKKYELVATNEVPKDTNVPAWSQDCRSPKTSPRQTSVAQDADVVSNPVASVVYDDEENCDSKTAPGKKPVLKHVSRKANVPPPSLDRVLGVKEKTKAERQRPKYVLKDDLGDEESLDGHADDRDSDEDYHPDEASFVASEDDNDNVD